MKNINKQIRDQIDKQIRTTLGRLPYPASARLKENLAVYLSAKILAHNFTNADIGNIRKISCLLASEFFGITKNSVQDKLSRQLGLSIEDYDDLLKKAVMQNNRNLLKNALKQACTDCYRQGDVYVINTYI